MSTPLEEFYITMPELPDHNTVIQHASSNGEPQTEPGWAVACLMVGAFLSVAAGAFLVVVGLGTW